MRPQGSLVIAAVAFTFVLASAGVKPLHSAPRRSAQAGPALAITTHSSTARALFEKGMGKFLNQKTEPALQDWRSALQADPGFALAHAFISYASGDPSEQTLERTRARTLAPQVTPGERLLIKWLAGVREGRFIEGIAAMNDLLAVYPKDKRLLYLAANWLLGQNSYERAKSLLLQALTLDKDYAPALNDLAYVYAATGDFQQAFASMEHCVAVLPGEPNPQNSYGEILRKGGNFQGALEHYRDALQLDPTFLSSQVGIADTYALMGDEDNARKEYAKAIHAAGSETEKVQYELQSALTYVREKKYGKANSALEAVAEHARNAQLQQLEAEAYRLMAMYQRGDGEASRYMERADEALTRTKMISQSDLEEERARVLRLQAVRNAAAGKTDAAQHALAQLQSLAEQSSNANIERSYHGARGSLLVLEHKYAQAIAELEEDSRNPCSMQLLVLAYSQTGTADRAHALELRIAALNEPTIEQALVVPELRAKLAATRKRKPWLSRILEH